MAAYVKYNSGIEYLNEGVNAGSDVWKLVLSNTAPNTGTHTVLADATEIANGNGYTAPGGNTITTTSSAQTSGTQKLVLADLTITASGGSIGPFRYAILTDSTVAGAPLIAYWDYGAGGVTLTDGESILVDFSAANGVYTIA